MPKQIPWHLQEIFGASTVEESLDATTPVTRAAPAAIPVLDTAPALRDFSKCAGAASQIVQKIELQELTDMLCPIDIETLAERDAARFSPTPKAEPGLDFVKRFLEEVLPNVEGMARLTPETSAGLPKFLGTFNKRAKGASRQDISRVMNKHYSHGIWRAWESMMSAYIGDDSFTEEKGLQFLKAGAL